MLPQIKKLTKIALALFLFIALSTLLARSSPVFAQAFYFPDYIDGSPHGGHTLSTGESISFSSEGGNCGGCPGGLDPLRQYKNSNFEQFFLGLGGVYRREDTSWAPLGWNRAHCSGGREAVYTLTPCQPYDEGQNITNDGVFWAPSTVSLNQTWTGATHQITPISLTDALSGNRIYCALTDLGGYPACVGGPTLQLTNHWGPGGFTFCTGITNPDDLIEITGVGGPGTGDTFYYMRGWGLVGFRAPGFEAGLMGPGADPSGCQGPIGSPGPGGGYIPCDTVDPIENHPLRPYPGEPCGDLSAPETPYCAMRPWAGTNITYLKNKNTCTSGGVCVEQDISGNYSIDPNSELPLVSVTRQGFDYLTFFNRSQEHHADYLEGRTHYDIYSEPDITDGDNDIAERASIWNRLGIFRKLAPLSLQNSMKQTNIQRAGTFIHNYIVSPDPYGAGGTPVRMSDFIGHYPPVYQCSSLTDPLEKETCKLEFFNAMETWRNSQWGQLWPRVPMVTREDTYGYVNVLLEPGQPPQPPPSTAISIPHLPRLASIADQLRKLLDPFFGPNLDRRPIGQPPANGLANCNPNATATDACVYSQPIIQDLANRWVDNAPGNQVDRCYNDVIARAKNSGFNAQLAMFIWLNESNASNYNITGQDFGVNNPALEYDFEAQISQMIRLATQIYPNQEPWSACFGPTAPINPETGLPMTAMEAFLWIYRTGFCDPNDQSGLTYLNNIRDIWEAGWISDQLNPACRFPTSPLIASIYPSSTTSELAGLFPECEAIVPPNTDFNLFTPQTMINNKSG